ncbi:Putative transcriptional regulator [Pedobacter cryoconitis]|uniref:Putative transcriptional regulator n=1 Tax=Pedobacter cryoconitis TaxID=188932 RepID=A0A127VDI0_9SPHI|nr:metalloregulator ArsR/SmtB family transcription factor [Pedobacter cryoconitis]AMP99319.1 Putative transcriptional regulator [Pedobacter cryoconitis]
MMTNRFLMLLKTRGALTASAIAQELGMTKEGARLQLLKYTEEGLIEATNESSGVGRPKQFFSLTASGHEKFPDTHAELTVKLINTIRNTLGDNALQSVMDANEQTGRDKYMLELAAFDTLEERIAKLTEIRSREGYMAEYSKDGDGYLFVENHCPICAAATSCQGFCSGELNVFRFVLGEKVEINRLDHIVSGDRRCSYRIALQ